jgi:hypothetical protein
MREINLTDQWNFDSSHWFVNDRIGRRSGNYLRCDRRLDGLRSREDQVSCLIWTNRCQTTSTAAVTAA